jgi:hypothetical protein
MQFDCGRRNAFHHNPHYLPPAKMSPLLPFLYVHVTA